MALCATSRAVHSSEPRYAWIRTCVRDHEVFESGRRLVEKRLWVHDGACFVESLTHAGHVLECRWGPRSQSSPHLG